MAAVAADVVNGSDGFGFLGIIVPFLIAFSFSVLYLVVFVTMLKSLKAEGLDKSWIINIVVVTSAIVAVIPPLLFIVWISVKW